jgi:hypothetical protein
MSVSASAAAARSTSSSPVAGLIPSFQETSCCDEGPTIGAVFAGGPRMPSAAGASVTRPVRYLSDQLADAEPELITSRAVYSLRLQNRD